MGGGKGKSPPPPDYSSLAAANKEAAEISAQVAREQLAWAKEQYASDSAANKEITDSYLPLLKQQAEASAKDRERYENVYQPLEDQLVDEAKTYATPERQDQEAARAVAGVDQQYEAARQAAEANLQSYGIDPGQIRAGALDLGTRVQEAANKAAAATQARQTVENVGRALRSEAINIGKGYPGQVAQSVQSAVQTGQAGAQTNLATTSTGSQIMTAPVAWQGASNQALGNWGDYSARIYNTQQMAQAQRSQSGIAGVLGNIAGRALGGWASGGFAAEGGVVPKEASPSRGKAVDDVPMHLSADEYVIPKDVVRRKGTDFFDRFIEKSRNPKAKGDVPKRTVQQAPQGIGPTGGAGGIPIEQLVAALMPPQQGAPA